MIAQIWVGILVLAGLIGCQREQASNLSTESVGSISTKQPTNPSPVIPVRVTAEDLKAYAKAYGKETREMYAQRHAAAIRKDGLFEHRHPINFWGQVVDQNGVPVAGVEVNPFWNDYVNSKPVDFKVKTDAEGKFKVLGGTGRIFMLHMQADEHLFTTRILDREYNYGTPGPERFIPDPTNPVQILVWRPTMPKQILERATRGHLPTNGNWIGFNLLETQFTPQGPLFLRARCLTPERIDETDLEIEIYMNGGGVVRTEEEYAWHPPEQGWKNSERVVVTRKEFMKMTLADRLNFYCRLDSPSWHGVVSLQPYAPHSRAPYTEFEIEYRFNTNGLKVVEYFPYSGHFRRLPSSTGGWEKGVLKQDPPGYEGAPP